MRSLRRPLCLVLLLFALTAACGDDDDNKSATTNETQLTSTTFGRPASTASGASTTAPATVVQGVTDGATCSPPNARGVTERGLPMVCTTIAGGNETRWRPA